jgi:hypothetical protein
LELRIRCYSDMAKKIGQGAKEVPFPSWFADTITGYWAAAGLPQQVRGLFFNPSGDAASPPIPAALSFAPAETDPGLLGWYFAISENPFPAGDDGLFALFIDPRTSAQTIYARKGKTPGSRTLRLHCTLYANFAPLDQGIYDSVANNVMRNSIMPFMGNRESIDVRISFDGTSLEISEYNSSGAEPVIFRGSPMSAD